MRPGWRFFSFLIRTEVEPLSLAPTVRREIRALDGGIPIRNLRAMEDIVHESMAPTRWSMMLIGTFAAIALTLATLGVFGVLSYVVAQRTRELGIRVALGASPGALRRMVVGRGLRLAIAGIGIGLAAGLGVTRLMSSLLFGVSPTDPITYIGVAVILFAIASLASYLPARRATSVDPIQALRTE